MSRRKDWPKAAVKTFKDLELCSVKPSLIEAYFLEDNQDLRSTNRADFESICKQFIDLRDKLAKVKSRSVL